MSHNMLEEIDKMYNKFCLKHRCQNKHFIQFIKLESPQYNSFNDFLIAKQNNSRLLIIVKNNLTDNFFMNITQPIYLSDMDIIETIQKNESLQYTISYLENILDNISNNRIIHNISFNIAKKEFYSTGIDYNPCNILIKLNIDTIVYINDLLFVLNFILLKEQYSNNPDALKLQIIKFLIFLKNKQTDLLSFIESKINNEKLNLSIMKNNFFKTYKNLILEFYSLI